MERFTGKSVIVTGAGSGIGAATARRFAAEGARVTLVGRGRAKLEGVARALEPDRRLVHTADVSQRAEVDAMVAATRARSGRIDVLVCNAGMAKTGRLEGFALDDWQRLQDINVTGAFHCCQAAIGALREAGGSIVAVSSVSGVGGDWGLFAYNAAKGAVSNLVRALALERCPT